MEKRNSLNKKPISAEQKEARKKSSAVDRARTKADLDKKNS